MKIKPKIKGKLVEVPVEVGDTISTSPRLSPPKDLQIHAHADKSGDSVDGGDNLTLTVEHIDEVLGYGHTEK